MKRMILSLCMMASLHTQAQVTTYYDWQWKPCEISLARFFSVVEKTDSGWLRNDFFMATQKLQMTGLYKDAATEIANGWFSYFYPNKKLSATGRYINGRKDGTWLSYHYNGMMSDSSVYKNGNITGTSIGWYNNGYMSDSAEYSPDGRAVYVSWFDNGIASSAGRLAFNKKEGAWQFFHKNGRLAALEKYLHGELQSRIYYDEEGTQLADTSNRDHSAVFRGNDFKWNNYLQNNLVWPRNVKIVNSDIVTVMLIATIDEEGNVEDVYVNVPFDPLFDDEALRVMKASPKWAPAVDHNRKIKTTIRQAISFRQE